MSVCFFSKASPGTQAGVAGGLEGDTWRGWEIPREASSFPPSHLPRAPPTGLAPRCQWDHSQTWPSEGARAAVPRSPAAEGTGASCLGGEQPCLGASKTKPCWAARAKAVAGTLRTSRLPGGGVRRAHGERCQSRCSAAPPSVRPMVSAGRSRQAQRAKGTGTHDLDWGHQSGGTPLPLQGLWAGSCPMRRVEQQMSIQKEGAA